MAEPFGVCSMCRKALSVGDRIWRCSVSTCNSGRVKFFFCSLGCWEAHLPTARHRNASAIDELASREMLSSRSVTPSGRRRGR